jgi:hypothetical protein
MPTRSSYIASLLPGSVRTGASSGAGVPRSRWNIRAVDDRQAPLGGSTRPSWRRTSAGRPMRALPRTACVRSAERDGTQLSRHALPSPLRRKAVPLILPRESSWRPSVTNDHATHETTCIRSSHLSRRGEVTEAPVLEPGAGPRASRDKATGPAREGAQTPQRALDALRQRTRPAA